jgi:peptidoglycan/LPS O-acetylase OafA/YrhL
MDPVGRFIERLSTYRFIGVELFFLISGFVICMTSWSRTLGHFFTSRVARLFPAYVAAVMGTAALLWLLPDRTDAPDHNTVAANLTMLQEFLGYQHIDTSYWTLVVELKFYLLFAVVVAFGVTYRRVVAFCLVWVTLSVLAMQPQLQALSVVVASDYCPDFLLGAILATGCRFVAGCCRPWSPDSSW